MCPHLLVHAVKRGATAAAALSTSFVPVTRPVQNICRSASEFPGCGAQSVFTRLLHSHQVKCAETISDGRAMTILGERKSSAKILNSEDRLEKLQAHVEKQVTALCAKNQIIETKANFWHAMISKCLALPGGMVN